MDIKIYQINGKRDKESVKFSRLDQLQTMHPGGKVDASIYDEVFSGNVSCVDLEDVYTMFNDNPHPLFRGHSLSMSDVVVVTGDIPEVVGKIKFHTNAKPSYFTDKTCFNNAVNNAIKLGLDFTATDMSGLGKHMLEKGAYYCDTVGFKKIDFDENKALKPGNLMTVVYVEPGRKPFISEVGKDLSSLQKAVKGYIEHIYNRDDTVIVANEEAKLRGMQGNRHYGNGKSIIAGPFFVCGLSEDDLRGLTDEEASKYMEKYAEPENISQTETEADMEIRVFFMN